MTNSEARKAVTMYVKGKSIAEIARKFGVTEPTIRYHIKRSKRGKALLPFTEKESFIAETARRYAAKDIAKMADLEECTTRNYACARHVSLEYDRIHFTPLELREVERYVNGKSKYETISELATAFNRPYGSVYQKVAQYNVIQMPQQNVTFTELVNTENNITEKRA